MSGGPVDTDLVNHVEVGDRAVQFRIHHRFKSGVDSVFNGRFRHVIHRTWPTQTRQVGHATRGRIMLGVLLPSQFGADLLGHFLADFVLQFGADPGA